MRRPRALTARSIADEPRHRGEPPRDQAPRDVAAEQKRRGRAERRADERVDHAAAASPNTAPPAMVSSDAGNQRDDGDARR